MAKASKNCIYLHGFASGPKSTKAAFFKEELTAAGFKVKVANLNRSRGEFSTLTMSRQIEDVKKLLPKGGAKVNLIGSSFGGWTSLWIAKLYPESVDRIILLAPAVYFWTQLKSHIIAPADLRRWSTKGKADIEHYYYKKTLPLDYGYIQDLQKYERRKLTVEHPAALFYGTKDETCLPSYARRFGREFKKNVNLYEIKDDHSLAKSLPKIWRQSAKFLGV